MSKAAERNTGEILQHYELEKKLAAQLYHAGKAERGKLYPSLYNELFEKIPFHPQLVNKQTPQERYKEIRHRFGMIRKYLSGDTVFLEIGAGDCFFSYETAKRVRKAYGLDVSDLITMSGNPPSNFQLIITDGVQIPLDENSVDFAYSDQLMEHLHPEDAIEQLHNIYRVLVSKGRYCCITPNRLTGPHDVSKYFDDTATCFHLKEYTMTELTDIFRKAGFRKIRAVCGGRGFYFPIPVRLLCHIEKWIGSYDGKAVKALAHSFPMKVLLDIKLIAQK